MRTNKCSVAVRNKQILRLGFHPNRGLGPQNQGVGCYLPLEPNGLPTNSRYHLRFFFIHGHQTTQYLNLMIDLGATKKILETLPTRNNLSNF